MKITASGGTDGANIVLFWPDNLPDDADAVLERDPIGFVESLRNDGKLIWFFCESDGEYTVAVFLHGALPDDLVQYCRDEECIRALVVRGVGYFGGMEYMFKHNRKLLDKYPGMCKQIEIPEGVYSARVYRTDVPESVYETWLESQVGVSAKRMWDRHATIAAWAVLSVFAALITFFLVSWTVWFLITAVASAFVFIAVAMSRMPWYKSVANARDDFEKAYPAYVVYLE